MEESNLTQELQLEKLKRLRPIDDTFMRCIFKNNLPLVQKVLRVILQKPDLTVTYSETQVDMKKLLGARSIVLDVKANDSTGTKYDMEVERSYSRASEHRARYHSSAIDVDSLKASQDFKELPVSYIIFITENDIYEQGLPFYRIERINIDTNQLFNDGEHILYVNGAYRGDDDIGNLMHDFSCSNPDDMIDKDMAESSRYYKETKEGRDYMCKVMEELTNEAKLETKAFDVKNIMEALKMTAEQAMDILKVPEDVRPKLTSML